MIRREGTPAVMLQWCSMSLSRLVGRAEELGRMSRMSHAMFRASRCSVDILVGSMIHRITRETTRGLTELELSVDRKVERGLGVVL